jgi:hypothetical protein
MDVTMWACGGDDDRGDGEGGDPGHTKKKNVYYTKMQFLQHAVRNPATNRELSI